MTYYDTSYLVRLYLNNPGAEEVRTIARANSIACAQHGKVELVSALHRDHREMKSSKAVFFALLDRFELDDENGAYHWISITTPVLKRAFDAYRNASESIFLRAADALHLACAAENGFREIYSNDRHLLAAAPLFGLKGKNVIPGGKA